MRFQSGRLLNDLIREAGGAGVERALLVCRTRGEGRELLRAIALRGVGWVGLEPTTPRSLALAIAGDELATAGLTPIDGLEEAALLDEAIDEVMKEGGSPLERLSEGFGFRQALANAIQALRLSGVAVADLDRVELRNEIKRQALRAMLEAYVRRLAERRGADGAAIFERATQVVEGRSGPGERILLAPGLPRGGLSGRFLELLRNRGAILLGADSVLGLEPPSTRMRPPVAEGERPSSPFSYLLDPAAFPGWRPSPAPDDGREAGGDVAPGAEGQFDLFHGATKAAGRGAVDPGSLRLFAAASPFEELREALGRVLAANRSWDEVEIVATDPIVYGVALDELATRLEIPVTYAVGLPVERSRPGRAALEYLEWISRDFPEEILRHLLANGDLRPPRGESGEEGGEAMTGGRLARRLRRLRVGWGRERYLETIAIARRRLEREEAEEPPDPRREREREELDALEALLRPILAASPTAPDRIGLHGAPVSPADLAAGLVAFLEFVPWKSAVEHEARKRLLERLDRIRGTLVRRTGFSGALAVLRRHLELRIPSPGAEGPAPWSSAGGHLHLADLDHGGRTGRPVTFVVGLDADRFPGPGIQDPILLDGDRRRLAPGSLPTSAELLEERRFGLASLLAGLRGEVTLSYSAWDAATGRDVPPAGVLLQAHRLVTARPRATYADLRESLGALRGPVPADGRMLDTTDLWLGALREDGLFRRGERLVLASFPGLGRGVAAGRSRHGEEFGEHAGRVAARPEVFDPRRNPELVLSATALERLGRCPLSYLLHDVLGLEEPDDPELDAGVWLSSRERGRLLHAVYEESLRRARDRGVPFEEPGFGALVLETLGEQIARFRGMVPVPSEAVFAREARDLEEDVHVFVHMAHQGRPDWIALEGRFGMHGDPAVELPVAGGAVRTRGYIDRIDRLASGRLRVVDYKTGRTRDYGAKTGIYHGGRRLQHAVYANAAARLHGAEVELFEYHFPTRRGDERPRVYRAADLAAAPLVIGRLLDLVAEGLFVPTQEVEDCRWCEHRPICRVRDDYRETLSPAAEWAKARWEELSEYESFHEVRNVDG